MLLVHAHPDDESIFTGLTMAKAVADGVGVTLVTCTRGELGEIHVSELSDLTPDELGAERARELDAAMAILGVTDHRFLGGPGRYRDSGMKWGEDGQATVADDLHPDAFWLADVDEAAGELAEVIDEVRPQVVITYDDFGYYGHPDHIQANRVAHRAVESAEWKVDRLYWCAAEGADVAITAPELLGRKKAAMLAHATQIRPDSFLLDLPPTEGFRLIQGHAPKGTEFW